MAPISTAAHSRSTSHRIANAPAAAGRAVAAAFHAATEGCRLHCARRNRGRAYCVFGGRAVIAFTAGYPQAVGLISRGGTPIERIRVHGFPGHPSSKHRTGQEY